MEQYRDLFGTPTTSTTEEGEWRQPHQSREQHRLGGKGEAQQETKQTPQEKCRDETSEGRTPQTSGDTFKTRLSVVRAMLPEKLDTPRTGDTFCSRSTEEYDENRRQGKEQWQTAINL
eukprot:4209099-Karenia_brevis.AAC.1